MALVISHVVRAFIKDLLPKYASNQGYARLFLGLIYTAKMRPKWG